MNVKQVTYRFFLLPVVLLAPPATLYGDTPAEKLLKKPAKWFASDEGQRTLGNVLSWQTKVGDWPKNMDPTKAPYDSKHKKPSGTFDNGATTGELRLLARAFRFTSDSKFKAAFLHGFDHILKAQHANGGWPQHYPFGDSYHRHITFNDGAMIRLMQLLRDIANEDDYKFIDQDRRAAATNAFQRGLQCIVKCQVKVDGVPTVWCAQHHAQTLVPVQARSYEHPSLSGAESAGVLRFLMDLDQPNPEVVRAVQAGAAWFQSAQINGYRYNRGKTVIAITEDANASPLWARFYEINTNRPIFSDRDGIIKYDIQQIGDERRGGYTWYGNWGKNVLKAYAKWPHRK